MSTDAEILATLGEAYKTATTKFDGSERAAQALLKSMPFRTADVFYQTVDDADATVRADYGEASWGLFGSASEIARGYVSTAVWCGVEYRSGDPRSDSDKASELNPSDIEPVSLAAMIARADKWAADNAALIERAKEAGFRYGPDYGPDEHLGHDLWLTSNHHGAGFWDGDYESDDKGDVGEALTAASESCGEFYLYTDSDGRIHCEGG